jgi:hypothetical protein
MVSKDVWLHRVDFTVMDPDTHETRLVVEVKATKQASPSRLHSYIDMLRAYMGSMNVRLGLLITPDKSFLIKRRRWWSKTEPDQYEIVELETRILLSGREGFLKERVEAALSSMGKESGKFLEVVVEDWLETLIKDWEIALAPQVVHHFVPDVVGSVADAELIVYYHYEG